MNPILLLALFTIASAPVTAQTAEEFYMKGKQNYLAGNTETARQDLTLALALDPNGQTGRAAKDFLRFRIPRFVPTDDAYKMQRTASKLEPKSRLEAIAAYEACSQKHPFFEYPLTSLSALYWREHKYDDAERCAVQALKINPASLMARANLGWCKMAQGDRESANKYFNEVLKLDPQDSIATDGLAQLKKSSR